MRNQNPIYPNARENSWQYMLIIWILLIWLIIFLISSLAVAASADRVQISFSDNRLSVHIENSRLINVLEEMRDKTGLMFEVAEDASYHNITVQLNSMPLETALKIILYDFNYSLVYDTDGNIQKVNILSGLQNRSSPEAKPNSKNGIVVNYPSGNIDSESHQSVSSADQRERTEPMDISVPSNSIMEVQPSDSQKMNITKSSQSMQIDPPKASDAMRIDFSTQAED